MTGALNSINFGLCGAPVDFSPLALRYPAGGRLFNSGPAPAQAPVGGGSKAMVDRPPTKFGRQDRARGRRAVEQRKRRLEAEPLCRDCIAASITPPRLATVPDHIKPLALGGQDTDDNIRCLCAEHHQARTAEQFGFKQKQAIGKDGWPT